MKGYEKAAQAIQSVKQVIIGKDDCVLAIMEAILANGHILIEDIPGVGKTSMALAFARVLDMKQSKNHGICSNCEDDRRAPRC